jgi:hypothetical protein
VDSSILDEVGKIIDGVDAPTLRADLRKSERTYFSVNVCFHISVRFLGATWGAFGGRKRDLWPLACEAKQTR